MISRVQHKQPAVSHKAIYVDVLGCCTYVYVLGLPRCFAGFPSQPCRVSVGCEEKTSHCERAQGWATVGGAGGGQVLLLWLELKPIEAAVQGGKGGQPAAGTCFPSAVRGKAAKAVSGQMDEIFPPGSSQVCVCVYACLVLG